jgi:hypothetical protein
MSYFRAIRRGEPPKPSFELLKPHLEAGHRLILLKPLSDEPQPGWISEDFPTVEDVRAHMAKGGNVGVLMRHGMLVIDVNTRRAREGVSPIRQLENSLGVNLSRGPLVLNGGCGQHFYFKHPDSLVITSPEFPGVKPGQENVVWPKPSLRFKHSLPEFPGLKFRTGYKRWLSREQLLLASGSVHPKTQEHCFCEILQDNLADAPLVPRELLVRILHKPRYSGRHELLGGRG